MVSRFPRLRIVGSAFSHLLDSLPQAAQAVVREGWMDLVGLGRILLSYWDLPGDCLRGAPRPKKRFCRTFSDCTTAPRNGMVSGWLLPARSLLRKATRGRRAQGDQEAGAALNRATTGGACLRVKLTTS
jgi:hypothetical protein